MKKASEYRQHADECRTMARAISVPEHKAALEKMAETWENLAREREERIAREQRIAALEAAIDRK